MSSKNIKKLKKEREKLLTELGKQSGLLHGSWFERYSICSRPNCKCHNGQKHGPRHYIIVNDHGTQKQKYVPNSQVNAARKGLRQYKHLQAIVDRITEINISLMREKAYAED